MLLRIFNALLFSSLLLAAVNSAALADAPSNVTLALDKTPGDEAIRRVLRAAGVNFCITDDVLRTASKFEVTKSFKDEAFKDALDTILRLTRDGDTAFRYRVEDTVRIVFQREASPAPRNVSYSPRSPKQTDIRISAKFNETPLNEALQQVFDKANIDYILPDVGSNPTVTMAFDNVPLEGAMISVLQPEITGYRFIPGDAILSFRPHFGGLSGDNLPLRMSARINMANIRSALKAFFTSLGLNYTLDAAVQGDISIGLKNVNPRTVLEAILRSGPQAAPLTYRVEDRVYIICPDAAEIKNQP